MEYNIAYIGLGSNLGDSMQNINDAIVNIAQYPNIWVKNKSHLYHSKPLEADGNDYINSVIRIYTSYQALELLQILQTIEYQFGRQRLYKNSPRELDLDLLIFNEETHLGEHLTLPHPRITDRAFVLLPLIDIDKEVSIPNKGRADKYLQEVSSQIIQRVKMLNYPNVICCTKTYCE